MTYVGPKQESRRVSHTPLIQAGLHQSTRHRFEVHKHKPALRV